jgi:chromosome segregation ATPase
MDVRQLQSQIDDLRTNAESKRQHAARLLQSASGYASDGNDMKAKAEQEEALKLERDADAFEKQVIEIEQQMRLGHQRIREIDDERARVEADYKQRLSELEKEKTRLLGGSFSLF